MTPDQLAIADLELLARMTWLLAGAVLALAASVTVMAAVTAVGYWVERRAWKAEQEK